MKNQLKKPKEELTQEWISLSDYNEYSALKSIEVSGAKLTESAIKKIAEFEAKFKEVGGVVANKTVKAAIKAEIVPLYKGVQVPKEYYDIIGKHKDYYFGQ